MDVVRKCRGGSKQGWEAWERAQSHKARRRFQELRPEQKFKVGRGGGGGEEWLPGQLQLLQDPGCPIKEQGPYTLTAEGGLGKIKTPIRWVSGQARVPVTRCTRGHEPGAESTEPWQQWSGGADCPSVKQAQRRGSTGRQRGRTACLDGVRHSVPGRLPDGGTVCTKLHGLERALPCLQRGQLSQRVDRAMGTRSERLKKKKSMETCIGKL